MRAFIIAVLFFVAFIMIVSSSMRNVNLTSNAPVVMQAAAAPTATQPLVITIQESPATTPPNDAFVPVTGGCANPYIVQPGDWLSKIAIICDTTLAAILQANPQIFDPNLIYPDQRINMPNADIVPVTGGCATPYTVQPGDWLLKIAANCETTLAEILQANPHITNPDLIYPAQLLNLPNTSAAVPVPVTGLVPSVQSGTRLQVQAIHFLVNTPVNVAIGPKSDGYTILTSGVTDASGNLTTYITVPTAPDSQTPWVVVVTTTSNPPTTVTSQPFYIK